MMGARSLRNTNAMKSLAMTKGGPSRKCVGWSAIDGLRRSNIVWPTTCDATPATANTAASAHTEKTLAFATIIAAVESNRVAATEIASPHTASRDNRDDR